MNHPCVLLAVRPTIHRFNYESLLVHNGFEVVTASDGIACLDALRSRAPDVLVIESDLPWGGGDGVLGVINDQWPLSNFAVVALISDVSWSATYSIAQYRIDDFAVQPVSPQQLLRRISRLAHVHGELVSLNDR